MMATCHACGRPKLKGAILDYENSRMAVDGRVILLTRKEADLMSVLVKDPAFTFTTTELANSVWGHLWPTDIQSAVSGLVMRIRRKLSETNLEIVAIPGHGYGLRQNVGGRA